ncbi:MAG: peptidoglycan recognition family protein [Oscillospiraceae bacterium]
MGQERRRRRRNLRPALILAAVFLIAGAGITFLVKHNTQSGRDIPAPDWVTLDFLTENPYSRPGLPLEKVTGVVVHYVGNPGTSAAANRSYFESLAAGTDGTYASAHFIVGLDGEVIQCIPLDEIAYASNSRNEDTIAVEVCHPDDTGEFSPVTLEKTEELVAWLCDAFHLKTESVIRHYDVTGKLCPKWYVEHEDAWADFLTGVEDCRSKN